MAQNKKREAGLLGLGLLAFLLGVGKLFGKGNRYGPGADELINDEVRNYNSFRKWEVFPGQLYSKIEHVFSILDWIQIDKGNLDNKTVTTRYIVNTTDGEPYKLKPGSYIGKVVDKITVRAAYRTETDGVFDWQDQLILKVIPNKEFGFKDVNTFPGHIYLIWTNTGYTLK